MTLADRPKCETHPFIHLTEMGCVLCEGERLAKVDHNRQGRVRPPKFELRKANVRNLPTQDEIDSL